MPDLEVALLLQAAAVADFNGDGIPDFASTGSTAVVLSLGKGDGTFGPFQTVSGSGFSSYTYGAGAVLHGDFNGDSRQDLLVLGTPTAYKQAPFTLLGHGDGTFAAPVASGFTPTNLAQAQVVDLNRDGRDDVFLSSNNSISPPVLAALLSNGDGTFREVDSPGPSEQNGVFFNNISPPRLADVEHTGTLDAVFASASYLYLARGHGDGTFDLPVTRLALPSTPGYGNENATSVSVADFDGDGLLDVAVTVDIGLSSAVYLQPSRTAVFLFYGTGGTSFTPAIAVAVLPDNGILLQPRTCETKAAPSW